MLNLKRSALIAVPTLAVLLLSGCGGNKYYTDRNYEYYHTSMVKPLELPATRNQSEFIDAMPVPNADQPFVAPKGHFRVPTPPGMTSAVAQPKVVVHESDGQRWLIVATSPSNVWPALNTFAQQQGGGVTATLPEKGTIETHNFTIAVRQASNQDSSTDVFCLTNNTTNQSCINALQKQLSGQSTPESND